MSLTNGQAPAVPQSVAPARREAAVPGRAALAEGHEAGTSGRLPGALRARMEGAFGADFSAVRVHEGGEANELGARAYAQGNDLHFAPGEYQPGTREGDELIGHELTHVVQQRQGRVSAPQGKGAPVNADEGLEHEADVAGAAAARGELTGMSGGSGAPSGAAPIQLKKKKGWDKGTELTEHKPGTQGAKQDYLALMDGDDDTRASKIAALFDNRSKSKNQRFYHLQTWLMGDNAGLEAQYQAKTTRQLRNDLKAHLSPEQYRYCISCLDHGLPQLEDRIRLAMGLLTGSSIDTKEVIFLFMGNSDVEVSDDDKLRAWGNLQAELQKLKSDKYKQLETHMDTLKLGRKNANQDGPITKEQHDRQTEAMLDAKDRELAALVMAQKGTLSMKRDKLGEVLPPWAAKQDDATRRHVTQPTSQFVTTLKKQIVKLPFGKEALFTQHDVDYAISIVRDGAKIDEAFFQDGETSTSQPTEKAREKREEKRSEEGAGHAEFQAYFKRKETNGAEKKWQWGTLKEKVEDMSPEQRDWFLRSNLTPSEQVIWDDEDCPHDLRIKMRTDAIKVIETRLKDMGMKGDGILNSGGDSTRKKILEAFRYGASDNTTAGGSTYQRLLKHAKENIDKTKFGKKAIALCRKLRGDEFAHVRGSPDLLNALQTKSTPKYWDRIQAILGITSGAHDGAKGDVDKDVLNATEPTLVAWGAKIDKKKHDLEDARELGANEAELMPSHWGMVLTAALKEARVLRRTEINSLVTRAWTAGKRRERLTQNQSLKLSGDRKLEPMTASDFVIATFNSISAGGRQVLEKHKSSKLHHAYEALSTGTRVSVDDQIEDSEFATLSLKHTSGFHASMEGLTHTFEDIDGKDLLGEWSNIDELRTAKTKGLPTRDFVLDVRADRMRYLEKTVPRAELVKTLSKLRKKIVGAAASDPEAIEMLRDEGFENDEYSQARTKNLGLLDEQRLRSTGAQYNTFLGGKKEIKALGSTVIGASSKSAQSKESTGVLLGHTRKAQSDLRGGKERTEVVDTHGKNIKDAQEDLERRGAAFDKMRKAYNKIVEGLAKALVIVVAAAAMAVVTVLTGGVGGAIGVAMIAGKTLITSLVMAGVKKALNGDSFNGEKAFWDIAFKTLINTGFAAVGAFGVPALLEHLGETVTSVGDGISSTSEFALPQDAGHAAWRMALEQGLTKGAKGIFREAVRAARDTDTNPANRAMIMLHLGSTVSVLGAKIGASAYAEYNEDLQHTSTNQVEKKSSDTFNKAVAKSPKALKVGFKALEMKLTPEDSIKGSDRGHEAEELVKTAIEAGQQEAAALKQQIQKAHHAGEPTRPLEQRWQAVMNKLQELTDLFDAYKAKLKAKGKEDVFDKVKSETAPLVDAAFKLLKFLGEPEQPQQQGVQPNAQV